MDQTMLTGLRMDGRWQKLPYEGSSMKVRGTDLSRGFLGWLNEYDCNSSILQNNVPEKVLIQQNFWIWQNSSSAKTTVINLGMAHYLASRAPTLDLWPADCTKSRTFGLQRFSWIGNKIMISNSYTSQQAKMRQQGEQMRVGSREGSRQFQYVFLQCKALYPFEIFVLALLL